MVAGKPGFTLESLKVILGHFILQSITGRQGAAYRHNNDLTYNIACPSTTPLSFELEAPVPRSPREYPHIQSGPKKRYPSFNFAITSVNEHRF